ncbi:tellurite resistance protein TerA [Acinetobacter calcoaceticus]|uniref:Tellurite resistance protein TerA n=1 Tax=Acinetobacter calcoaceticus TaxID=471 RepID=A0A4R1XSD2_ACICA|nr:tellurite resistance protein TerA [Acinetobacter calcoaceticus]
MQLVAGANVALTDSIIEISLKTSVASHLELDLTAYLLDRDSLKVRGDADMIFYGQKHTANRSVELIEATQKSPYLAQVKVNTALLDQQIGKIALCISLNEPHALNQLQPLQIELKSAQQVVTSDIVFSNKTEKALILAEIYQHQGKWKYRFVDQGFNGGLKPLAENYGVVVAEPTQAPPTPPSPQSSSHSNQQIPPHSPNTSSSTTNQPSKTINLSKVTLDKQNSSIQLTKKGQGFGRIVVNLNWSKATDNKQAGFFNKLLNNKPIDLDLGAMVRLKNGDIDLVQPLGNAFGQYDRTPFLKLQGDDRTGAATEGENLFINGDQWQQIDRIIIYTYIYQGVPNWAATDAVVSISLPDQPPIEVRLTEGGRLGTCAIVELVNQQGTIQANREVRYFKDQLELDRHYGFGFNWSRGSKD